jgi:hypothetical protein
MFKNFKISKFKTTVKSLTKFFALNSLPEKLPQELLNDPNILSVAQVNGEEEKNFN